MLKKIIGPKVGFATTSGLKKQRSHAHLKLGNYKTGQDKGKTERKVLAFVKFVFS